MALQSCCATRKTMLWQSTSSFWPCPSYAFTTSSSEIRSNSTFCEEKSFTSGSFRSNASLNSNPMASLSHHCIATLRTQAPQISCLAVHDNTLYVASANEMNVFDLTNFALMDTFSCSKSSSGLVKSIAFREGKIFTGHQDCKIRVWQVTESKTHHLVSTLPTIKDSLRRCILPKNYVQVRRHKQKLWIEHVDTISGLALNNGLMYSISWDKSFKIWKMSDHCCLESVPNAHEDSINAIVVSADGFVYTASGDGNIKVWEKANGEKKHTLVTTLEKHSSNVNALALSTDGSMLLSGGSDQNILVWEREDSADHLVLTWSLTGHTNAILCLTYIGDLLISGSADRTLRVWQKGLDCGYHCLAILEGHLKPIKSLVAVSDVQANGIVTVFSGSLDGEIKVWQLAVSALNSMSSTHQRDQFHDSLCIYNIVNVTSSQIDSL